MNKGKITTSNIILAENILLHKHLRVLSRLLFIAMIIILILILRWEKPNVMLGAVHERQHPTHEYRMFPFLMYSNFFDIYMLSQKFTFCKCFYLISISSFLLLYVTLTVVLGFISLLIIFLASIVSNVLDTNLLSGRAPKNSS